MLTTVGLITLLISILQGGWGKGGWFGVGKSKGGFEGFGRGIVGKGGFEGFGRGIVG